MQFQSIPQQPNAAVIVGVSASATSGGAVQPILNPNPGTQYQLWEILIDIMGGTDGTPGATIATACTLTVTLHNAGLVIMRSNIRMVGPDASIQKCPTKDFHGWLAPESDGLDLAVTSLTTGFTCQAVANITYSSL